MQLYRSLAQLKPTAPTILTIGKFNGMHLGHQHLLRQVVARAHDLDAQSAALTFEPHPTLLLQSDIERVYLAPEAERLRLLEASGIDQLIVLTFDHQLMRLTAEQFMEQLCAHVRLRELWIGPDFRLGHKAQGTIDVLRELGQKLNFTVQPIAPLHVDGAPISATRIRTLLQAGQVGAIPPLLGRPFALVGDVVKGDQRGRTIGFPTANVAVGPHYLLPADGVYACHVTLPDDVEYPAVTNVGVRPTFGLLNRTVEAHLLDWSGDLYGQIVRVAFAERIRGEQKFSGIDELKAQIGRDAQRARELLGRC